MVAKSSAAKSNILDFFYEHISDDDWLDGLDMYQGEKVIELNDFDGLVTGKVEANFGPHNEVRLKIHPSGHQIQWIECTCRKNRVLSQYCEHMAATMIHIDRENPRILGQLDSNMPMKPPSKAKRGKGTVIKEPVEEGQGTTADDAILNYLEGSIHSVSLMAKGPKLRVRLEIKEGQLTHYDLELDQAAKFLKQHPKLKCSTAEVLALKVFKQPAESGTHIFQAGIEEVVAERVIALKHVASKKKAAKSKKTSVVPTLTKRYKKLVKGARSSEATYELITVKTVNKFIGKEYFFLPGRGYWPMKAVPKPGLLELPLRKLFKGDPAATFIREEYTPYIDEGPVWLDESLNNPVITEMPKIAEIKIKGEEEGWFTLDPRYGSGAASVSMTELMKQYRGNRRSYHKTGEGWMKIPDLVKQYDWALDETGEYLRVDALGLMRLKAAMGDFDHFVGSKKMLSKIRDKVEFNHDIKAPSLSASQLDLRSYQNMGLQWFWWLYQNGLHGLLADEMGLGKTHQAMALMTAIQQTQDQPKFLVVCPTTVLDHWYDKMQDFCPNLNPIKHHGAKRTQRFNQHLNGSDVLITSYGVVLRDIRHLSQIKWDAIILDEAHFVKNNSTATYKSVCRLNSRIRICLTGTPMENNLSELKNIFDFLVPGYLGSDDYFKKQFLSPIAAKDAPETELELQKLLHPFKMRRTKNQVLKDLPEKVEDFRHCDLSTEQVGLYRDIVNMRASPLVAQLQNEQNPIPFLHVFATLTMLKQVCNHPCLLAKNDDYKKHESGKFDLLRELLDEALGSGHKVVIYSQYVGMIKIIEKYLTDHAIGHSILTGQTRNRGKVIKKFQEDDDTKVFVGSLLAGGIGIDLTAASVVIHYDRWWNASKENQATDRVHRIGQNKNVQVLKLITRGTLEEKIDRMIKAKQALFEKFLDKDEEVFKTLSRQELIELLQ